MAHLLLYIGLMTQAKDGRKIWDIARNWGSLTAISSFLAALPLFSSSYAAPVADEIQFHSFQTHTHVKFPVELDVAYKVEKIEKGKGIRLIFENAGKTYLGRMGVSAEGGPIPDVTKFIDRRTAKVVRKVVGSDVVFEFVMTDQAKKTGIEFFDYRNRASSEVLIDYWTSSAVAEVPSSEHSDHRGKQTKEKNDSSVKMSVGKGSQPDDQKNRSIASVKNDFMPSGCARPLNIATDGFLMWNVYHKPFNYEASFKLSHPDVRYKYSQPEPSQKAKANDVAHYLLALKLYRENRFGLVLRTVEFFDQNFPTSALANEIHFLKANTLLKLSAQLNTERFQEQAVGILKSLMVKDAANERGQFSRLFLLQDLMKQSKWVQALESSLVGAQLKDVYEPVYHLAAAECLQAIGERERAQKTYQQVWDQKGGNPLAAEGAFRLGEVYMLDKNYDKALAVFIGALRDFPEIINKYPTAVFNHAETYFRLGQYKEAQEMYQEFQLRFPLDSMAWAADLRVAEIAQVLTEAPNQAKANLKAEKVKDLYEQIINRHPYTPGAFLAELRLSECADFDKSPREKNFFSNFFKNKNLEKHLSPLIVPVDLKKWADLSELRFINRVGEYAKVLPFADTYRGKLAGFSIAESIRVEISNGILSHMRELSHDSIAENDEDGFYEVLEINTRYGDYIPSPRPFSYLLSLAQANQGINNLNGTAAQIALTELRVKDASSDERDEFYALVARHEKATSPDSKSILEALIKISDDGELSSFKYDQMAETASRLKDYKQAIEFDNKLLETTRGEHLGAEPLLKAHVRRLENYRSLKDYAAVLKYSDRLLLSKGAATEFRNVFDQVRYLRADALFSSGQYSKALDAYTELLSLQQDHPRRTEFEFLMARCLDRMDRGQEALDSYRKIATSDKGIWGKSAKAEVEQRDFKMNRIDNSKKN